MDHLFDGLNRWPLAILKKLKAELGAVLLVYSLLTWSVEAHVIDDGVDITRLLTLS